VKSKYRVLRAAKESDPVDLKGWGLPRAEVRLERALRPMARIETAVDEFVRGLPQALWEAIETGAAEAIDWVLEDEGINVHFAVLDFEQKVRDPLELAVRLPFGPEDGEGVLYRVSLRDLVRDLIDWQATPWPKTSEPEKDTRGPRITPDAAAYPAAVAAALRQEAERIEAALLLGSP
jgi:hypothetical protein